MRKLVAIVVSAIFGVAVSVSPVSAAVTWTITAGGTLPSPYSAQSAVDYGTWSGQILETSIDGTRLITSDSAAFNSGQPSTNRYVYLSADSGQTWTNSGLPAGWWGPVAISGTGQYLAAASYGLGGQGGGPLYTSSDYGATWQLSSAGNKYWWNIKMSADGSFIIATNDHAGVPYVSYNYGNSWAAFTGFASSQWRDLGVSADGKVVAVCNNNANATSNGARIYISRSGAVPTNFSTFTETIDQAAGTICGSMDMAGTGDRLVSNTYSAAKTWIWRYSAGSWTQVNLLQPPTDWPTAPAISFDGLKIYVPGYGQEHDYYSTDGGVTFDTFTRTDLATKVGNASITPDGSKIIQIATDKVYVLTTGVVSPPAQQQNVVVSLLPATYMNGVTGNSLVYGSVGRVKIAGSGFKNVAKVQVNGELVKNISVTDEFVEFDAPSSLPVGAYSIVLTGAGVNFTYQDGFKVKAKPIAVEVAKKTITCVKAGKSIKVSAVAPRCPSGYKKR